MTIIIGIIITYLAAIRYQAMLYLGVAMHGSYILYRGITAGRLPIVGIYDTLTLLSFSIIIFGLAHKPYITKKLQLIGGSALSAIVFLIPTLFLTPHNKPLPPILKTFWFEIHVVLSFFAYALFVIGAVIGILFLVYKDSDMERLQYRSIFIGYTFFSIAMIAGGIWAFYAWGTYWLWTPKELWTSILWLYYSVYLHARLQKRLSGAPASLTGSIGMIVMLFTYLGVGIFMKSSHSF